MHAGDNRTLAWAALASLALHTALVAGWPRMQERLRPAPPSPIVSRIVETSTPEPPKAAAPQVTAEKSQPDPKPAESKPPSEAKRPAEKKPRAEKPAAEPLAKPAERAPEPQRPSKPSTPESAPQPAPAAEPSPSVAAVVPTPSPAPGPLQPGPSQAVQPQPAQPSVDAATTIAQYRMQVLSAARRLKGRYPDLARENNWSGSVVVALAVGADGGTEVRLKSGTGHAPLDQQASDMFRRAARAVPVPTALQGRAFSVELKAVYGLVD